MDDGRYTMTLDEVPAEIIAIRQIGVPCGLIQPRMEAGYLLTDGTALLESEKDENGFYIGGAGMDGMYLRTPQRYEPVRDDSGKVTAFRLMSSYLTRFSGQELEAIFQYGLNTKENLLHDLEAVVQAVKQPEIRAAFPAHEISWSPSPRRIAAV